MNRTDSGIFILTGQGTETNTIQDLRERVCAARDARRGPATVHHLRGLTWNLVQSDGRERAGTGPAPVLRSYAELELLRLHDRYVYTEVQITARDDDPKVLETRQAAATKQPTTLLIMANAQMLNCILRTIQNLLLSPQCSARRKWPKIAERLSCTCRCASARFSTFPRIP